MTTFKPTQPLPHQKQAVRQAERWGGRLLLGDEAGLGKSLSALWYLRRNADAFPALILCESTLKLNWRNECRQHMNWPLYVCGGTTPPPLSELAAVGVAVINYDILQHWLPVLQKWNPQAVIIDECHNIKGRTAQRTKLVQKLCRKVPHVLALSATPITNCPAEFWPTLSILRPDLFKSRVKFEERYCGRKLTIWGWEAKGATRADELNELLRAEVMLRRLKSEVLPHLAPKISQIVELSLTNSVQYQIAESGYQAWARRAFRHGLTRQTKATALAKFHELRMLVNAGKRTAVLEWVENFLKSDKKLVVYGVHQEFVSAVRAAFGAAAVMVYGQTTPAKRQLAIDRFQNTKRVRLFVGNIRAAGVGINLTAGHHVAFGELGYTPAEHIQAADRVHRLTQTEQCYVHYLIANGTVEERISRIILRKLKTIHEILDGQTPLQSELAILQAVTTELLEQP